jgi:LemA protein
MAKYALGCLGLLVVAAIILGFAVMGTYNGLVGSSQAVDTQWAQVQTVYQRRADLIPNLVSTVAGAANFEKSTLEAVTNARASVGQVKIDPSQAPSDPAQLAKFQAAQAGVSSALSRLLVVSENYPNLKSNENFLGLQAQLEGTENRISVERQKFNAVAQAYNTKVKTFPTVVFAGMMGFSPKPYFSADAGAEKAPAVKFNFGATPAPAQ